MICTYCEGVGTLELPVGPPHMVDYVLHDCAMCNGTGLNNLARAIEAAEQELGCQKGELW